MCRRCASQSQRRLRRRVSCEAPWALPAWAGRAVSRTKRRPRRRFTAGGVGGGLVVNGSAEGVRVTVTAAMPCLRGAARPLDGRSEAEHVRVTAAAASPHHCGDARGPRGASVRIPDPARHRGRRRRQQRAEPGRALCTSGTSPPLIGNLDRRTGLRRACAADPAPAGIGGRSKGRGLSRRPYASPAAISSRERAFAKLAT